MADAKPKSKPKERTFKLIGKTFEDFTFELPPKGKKLHQLFVIPKSGKPLQLFKTEKSSDVPYAGRINDGLPELFKRRLKIFLVTIGGKETKRKGARISRRFARRIIKKALDNSEASKDEKGKELLERITALAPPSQRSEKFVKLYLKDASTPLKDVFTPREDTPPPDKAQDDPAESIGIEIDERLKLGKDVGKFVIARRSKSKRLTIKRVDFRSPSTGKMSSQIAINAIDQTPIQKVIGDMGTGGIRAKAKELILEYLKENPDADLRGDEFKEILPVVVEGGDLTKAIKTIQDLSGSGPTPPPSPSGPKPPAPTKEQLEKGPVEVKSITEAVVKPSSTKKSVVVDPVEARSETTAPPVKITRVRTGSVPPPATGIEFTPEFLERIASGLPTPPAPVPRPAGPPAPPVRDPLPPAVIPLPPRVPDNPARGGTLDNPLYVRNSPFAQPEGFVDGKPVFTSIGGRYMWTLVNGFPVLQPVVLGNKQVTEQEAIKTAVMPRRPSIRERLTAPRSRRDTLRSSVQHFSSVPRRCATGPDTTKVPKIPKEKMPTGGNRPQPPSLSSRFKPSSFKR